jgi:hypothetical protein
MNSQEATDEEAKRVVETLYRPNKTEEYSEPMFRFIAEYDTIVQAFFFTVMTAVHIDGVKDIAAKALGKSNSAGEESAEKQLKAFDRVRGYSPLFSRNLIMGMANNFFSFVSETLQVVLRKRPEVLRSSERLTNEEVLQFTRINELVAYMADKKVNELAYGGLKGVEDYVKERLGLALFDDEVERLRLTVLAELRNIHTHNRGVVNELFLKRIGHQKVDDLQFKLGQRTHVDFEHFAILSRNAIIVAKRLDVNLCKKFRIKRAKYGEWGAKQSGAQQSRD